MIFEYYRQKVIRMQYEIPTEIPKSVYKQDLQIERSSPMNTLLVKEIQRYNKLIMAIKDNLASTRSTLEGHRQHDSSTEDTFECLQTLRTP